MDPIEPIVLWLIHYYNCKTYLQNCPSDNIYGQAHWLSFHCLCEEWLQAVALLWLQKCLLVG